MGVLIRDCEKYFGTTNLYDVLAVDQSSSPLDIKRAYKKSSLLIHPDKVSADAKALAGRRFDVLSKVHFILSDPEKRAAYDEIGLINEENSILDNDSTPEFWREYWRNLFPKVTAEDINLFFSTYKGSDEEINDLKCCYLKSEGDMNLIAETFIGYDFEEEGRFRELLLNLIDKNDIPSFSKFVGETSAQKAARVKRFKSEAQEAAMVKKTQGSEFLTAISRRVQERERNFNSMIKSLESKYGDKKAKGKKKQNLKAKHGDEKSKGKKNLNLKAKCSVKKDKGKKKKC